VRSGNHTDDVTDLVHPETAATASLAARIVGLDIAGVDLVCEDISRPLDAQRGAIVEVNAGPGLLMHLKPAIGQPRPVGRAIVDELFPNGDDGRIPVVGVTGSFGKTTVARLIARCSACPENIPVWPAVTDCSSIGVVSTRVSANWGSAHRILMNRSVEAAVFENGSDSILSEGLAYDRCQVGVITNVDPPSIVAVTTSRPPSRYSPSCARRSIWCCRRAPRSSTPGSRCWSTWRRSATVK
jgi:cyanophycin synthetase